jgi:ABC-2 type transport system ATP-binding protein
MENEKKVNKFNLKVPKYRLKHATGRSIKDIIVLSRVSKWYGQVIGLNDISLRIKPGITGLLGPNGAGKSTMFKLITGQIKPKIGTVKVKGERVWNNQKLWNHMGYCPEYDNFWEELTGFEFIHFLCSLHGIPNSESEAKTEAVLDLVGMVKDSKRKIKGYSKGMRQRIKVAQALVHDPDILILDEPLSGTDPIAKFALTRLFHELETQGKTIVISSHVLEEIERITDNILLINKGRLLAEGRIEEIRDLIDKYPHNIQIRILSQYVSTLAKRLIKEDFVISVTKQTDGSGLLVQTHKPDRFYTEIAKILKEEDVDVSELTSTDDNLDAVFRYLVE